MTDFPHLRDVGADPMQVSRWRSRLADPVLFDEALRGEPESKPEVPPLAKCVVTVRAELLNNDTMAVD